MACPEASIGWGVPLTDAPVGWALHPSLRQLDKDGSLLLGPEPQGTTESYWEYLEVVPTGYPGYPRHGLAVFVKRTLTVTGDSTGDVDPSTLTPPDSVEVAVLTRYLNETAFAGNRRLRLLLAAREV